MSKTNRTIPNRNNVAQAVPAPPLSFTKLPNAQFKVPYPAILLAIIAMLMYVFRLQSMGFTELDDSIFVKEFQSYNEHWGSLFTSFQRGVFGITDPYYRPLFLDSVILNYQLFGDSITAFHTINILFHAIAVVLLYRLFLKLGVKELHSFILCALFAVHPVLSQAVAWIPGRNDTMLGIFTFSYLIYTVNYTKGGQLKDLLLSALFLLLSYFTKETAVFAPPAALLLLTLVLNSKLLSKNNIVQYATWAGCFAVWYVARAMATAHAQGGVAAGHVPSDILHRLPLIVQYTGKVFLPVNLSVFPMQNDTVNYYGLIAIAGLAVLLFLNPNRNWRIIACGLGVFLLFLLPALLVPANLNEQSFEHRLYLPMIGILLVLPQTILFQNKLTDKRLLTISAIVAGVLAVGNYEHQQYFEDPVSFWTQAVETSPHSAYANMMLAARIDDLPRSYELFHKAYSINPKEKYLNFYMGEMLEKKDSLLAAEPYFLKEKEVSNYFKCDYYLARIAVEKKDYAAGIGYMRAYLQHVPEDGPSNNNLLLLYLNNSMPDSARAQVRRMRALGLQVPPQIVQQLSM